MQVQVQVQGVAGVRTPRLHGGSLICPACLAVRWLPACGPDARLPAPASPSLLPAPPLHCRPPPPPAGCLARTPTLWASRLTHRGQWCGTSCAAGSRSTRSRSQRRGQQVGAAGQAGPQLKHVVAELGTAVCTGLSPRLACARRLPMPCPPAPLINSTCPALPAAEKILGKEPELKADFSRSQQAMSKARQKGVARFLPNPGAVLPAGRLRVGLGEENSGCPACVDSKPCSTHETKSACVCTAASLLQRQTGAPSPATAGRPSSRSWRGEARRRRQQQQQQQRQRDRSSRWASRTSSSSSSSRSRQPMAVLQKPQSRCSRMARTPQSRQRRQRSPRSKQPVVALRVLSDSPCTTALQ